MALVLVMNYRSLGQMPPLYDLECAVAMEFIMLSDMIAEQMSGK